MTDLYPQMHTSTVVDILPGVDLEISTIRRQTRAAWTVEYTALVAIDRRGLLRRDLVWSDLSEMTPQEAWNQWLESHPNAPPSSSNAAPPTDAYGDVLPGAYSEFNKG